MSNQQYIIDTYEQLRAELAPYGADLVAVSKRQPEERVRALAAYGHRLFGENRVADFLDRRKAFEGQDLDWHFIGSIQSKKISKLAGIPSCIQSVDRLKVAQMLNEQCATQGIRQRILLQFKVAQEEQKHGYALKAFLKEYDRGDWADLTSLDIEGIMGMTTLTDDYSIIRKEYRALAKIYELLKRAHFTTVDFHTLSMGMTNDYRVALDEGSTMIRVGRKLFGARDY